MPLPQNNNGNLGGAPGRNEVVASGPGVAVLAAPLVWMPETLGVRGVAFKAGSVALPGSATAAVPMPADEVVMARSGGVGTVAPRFLIGGGAPS